MRLRFVQPGCTDKFVHPGCTGSAKPNPQAYFDHGIVQVEIRCRTLPAPNKSRREAMMRFVGDPAAGVGSG